MTVLTYAIILAPLTVCLLQRRSLPAHYAALAIGLILAGAWVTLLIHNWNTGLLAEVRRMFPSGVRLSHATGEVTDYYVLPPITLPMGLIAAVPFGLLAVLGRWTTNRGWQPTHIDLGLFGAISALVLTLPSQLRLIYRFTTPRRYEDYQTAMQLAFWLMLGLLALIILLILVAGIRMLGKHPPASVTPT